MNHLVSLCILLSSLFVSLLSFDHNNSVSSLSDRLSCYDYSGIIKTLSYDPCITFYPDQTNNQTINDDHSTIYVNGWGEDQSTISYLKTNSDLLPGNVIGFNFNDNSPHPLLPNIKNTNFCQTNDIAALLMVLKALDECAIPKFHLFGTTRGGGTIVTTINRLTHYNSYKTFFQKLAIDTAQAYRILKKIIKGTIVLNCPLIDVNSSLKNILQPYGVAFLASAIDHAVLPLISSYRPRHDCPLKAAHTIAHLNIPTLVHFQKNNLLFGNNNDAEFYTAIYGKNSYLVLGNDCVSAIQGKTLNPALHAFRRKHNGPYVNDTDLLSLGELSLVLAQPEKNEIKIMINSFYSNSTYLFIPEKTSDWQNRFATYNLQTITSKLGYDPVIRVFPTDKRVKKPSATTVYVHGYGSNYKYSIPLIQVKSHIIAGTIVSFNFQDITEGTFKLKVGKSSVMQSGDIASLLMVLKTLDECGLETINLLGYSRGGGTIVTTLAYLCTYQEHQAFFKHLEISKEQAERIVLKIAQGTIILNCPLVDSNSVATYWFGRFDRFFMTTIIPRIMEHKHDKEQALHAASIIKSMNFNILVHFQKNDKILGNSLVDAQFYNNLKGPNTYLVIGNDGGHIHSGKTLGKAVQAFKKRYDSAYFPINDLLKDGEILLNESPKTDQEVIHYVKNIYF